MGAAPRRQKTNKQKDIKWEEVISQGFKISHLGTVAIYLRYRQTRLMGQKENPEIEPHKCAQLIFKNYYYFFFLGPHLQYMGVPRLGV